MKEEGGESEEGDNMENMRGYISAVRLRACCVTEAEKDSGEKQRTLRHEYSRSAGFRHWWNQQF